MVFALAVRHKVTQFIRFKATLQAYELLPQSLVAPAAGALAGLELVTIVLLVALQGAGIVLAVALLALYAMAMLINMARGRSEIDCGCGDEPTELSGWLLLRNVSLIVIGIGAWMLGFAEITFAGLVVGLGCTVVAALLYMTFEQILANRSLHTRLWLGEA